MHLVLYVHALNQKPKYLTGKQKCFRAFCNLVGFRKKMNSLKESFYIANDTFAPVLNPT